MNSLRYIPDCLTPLAFTALFAELSELQRLRYNQLHGLYLLEQTIFFEQAMGLPALHAIIRHAPTEELRSQARQFAAEEDLHTSWFREVLRDVDPRYAAGDFRLLGASPVLHAAMTFASRRVRSLPSLLWLQLIAEERALYYGRLFLEHADGIDPRFLAVQKRHLADEPAHIRRDILFLEWLWPQTPVGLRRINAWLLRWVLREFFLMPKRSSWRVIEHWLSEFPALAKRRVEFRAALAGLRNNRDFVRTLYPRRHFPKSCALAASWPELGFVENFVTD
jgi:hypothetical protein